MNPGSQSDVVSSIIARFSDGKGATIHKDYAIGKDAVITPLTIYLCPTRLCDDVGSGLILIVEGRGAYVWDGVNRLNPYKLLSSGIKPIALAQELSNLCNNIVATLAAVKLQHKDVLALTYEGVKQ